MIILDTDHLSVVTDERHSQHAALVTRMAVADQTYSVSIVSIEEQLGGWLAKLHRLREGDRQIEPYDRVIKFIRLMEAFEIVRWDERATIRLDELRSRRINIGTQDLKIAALALSNDATVLTANLKDFTKVPGLRIENWIS